jgi:hypothetical protein
MAGTFGYEAGHYDISMQMAEVSLLPAVRKVPNAIVVADGTSCRHQIHDGAQREALHVARLLERQLAVTPAGSDVTDAVPRSRSGRAVRGRASLGRLTFWSQRIRPRGKQR